MTTEVVIDDNLRRLYHNEGREPNDWRAICAYDKVENIKKLIGRDVPERILEIGCGDGALLSELSKQGIGKELFGLEVSESLVETVKNRKIPNLRDCILFNGYSSQFHDLEFDLVILSHVIEHVEHPRLIINEAKRVGRRIVMEVPLEDTVRLKKNFILTTTGHINFYSYKTFRNLVQSCGLVVNGEVITNPSFKVYRFKGGAKNIIKYFIREILLIIFGRSITKIFTYHYTVLCSGV